MDIQLKITTSQIQSRFCDVEKFYKILNATIHFTNNSESIKQISQKLKMCIQNFGLNSTLTVGTSATNLWVSFKDDGHDMFLISCPPISIPCPLDLVTVLDFGEFKGRTVEYALNKDHHYIVKCLQDIEHFSLTSKAEFMLLEKQAEELEEYSEISEYIY